MLPSVPNKSVFPSKKCHTKTFQREGEGEWTWKAKKCFNLPCCCCFSGGRKSQRHSQGLSCQLRWRSLLSEFFHTRSFRPISNIGAEVGLPGSVHAQSTTRKKHDPRDRDTSSSYLNPKLTGRTSYSVQPQTQMNSKEQLLPRAQSECLASSPKYRRQRSQGHRDRSRANNVSW